MRRNVGWVKIAFVIILLWVSYVLSVFVGNMHASPRGGKHPEPPLLVAARPHGAEAPVSGGAGGVLSVYVCALSKSRPAWRDAGSTPVMRFLVQSLYATTSMPHPLY